MTVSYKYIYFGARSLDIYAIEPHAQINNDNIHVF